MSETRVSFTSRSLETEDGSECSGDGSGKQRGERNALMGWGAAQSIDNESVVWCGGVCRVGYIGWILKRS